MHPAEPQDEMLQCYDDQGNPTVALPRKEVKQKPYRYWYAVARIWLVNERGEILITRRAESLAAAAGKWQSYVGGHVGEGHTILETAVRELEEEAGIKAEPSDFHLIDQGRNDDNKAFFEGYAVRFDGIIDLAKTDGEVIDQKWMTFDDYETEKNANPDVWCNGMHRWQHEKIVEWLAS